MKFNPSVADGLKSGSMLFFPVEESEVLTPDNANRHGVRMLSHTVAKGRLSMESLKKYGISTDAPDRAEPHCPRRAEGRSQTLHLTAPVIGEDNSAASAVAAGSASQEALLLSAQHLKAI